MLKSRRCILGVVSLIIAAGTCFGEDVEPAKFFKLEFVIKEVEGTKTVNTRSYSMVVSAGGKPGEIRAGSKLPYISKQGGTTEYQQIDVGVRIDARAIRQVENRLAFATTVEISLVAESATTSDHPVIRQNVWSTDVIVPFKKPTLLFSSDSLDSKSQMQAEVTATPLL